MTIACTQKKLLKARQFGESESAVKKGTSITSCNSLEQANETARQLNLDPWYLDRGNTRADRAAKYS
jgi:hypothetical protein